MAFPTINTKTYTFDTYVTPDLARYVGPDAAYDTKDHFDLRRVAPKASGAYPGNSRTYIKRVKTAVYDAVTGAVGDIIIEISVSAPAGTLPATIIACVDDAADFAITTEGQALVSDHKITV